MAYRDTHTQIIDILPSCSSTFTKDLRAVHT